MAQPLTISIEDAMPHGEVARIITSLLDGANTEFNYLNDPRNFCAVLKDSDGSIVGGVKAQARFDWLSVGELVVGSEWRDRGYGRQLLVLTEEWGREQRCHDSWLSTLSVKARQFYERAGYSTFAELPHFPERQTRFFMRKAL